jgi:hypothetical protein
MYQCLAIVGNRTNTLNLLHYLFQGKCGAAYHVIMHHLCSEQQAQACPGPRATLGGCVHEIHFTFPSVLGLENLQARILYLDIGSYTRNTFILVLVTAQQKTGRRVSRGLSGCRLVPLP